jgi:hypothetical protein
MRGLCLTDRGIKHLNSVHQRLISLPLLMYGVQAMTGSIRQCVLPPDPPSVENAYAAQERLVLGPDYPGAQTASNGTDDSSVVIAQLIGSLKPPQ